MNFTREQIEKAVKSKGYVWFDGAKDYDLNIVGVRNSSTGQLVTNVFDDVITLSYRVGGVKQFKSWVITTDPGKRGVVNYNNPNGVARLVEGQYRSAYGTRLHKGVYEALCQKGELSVYRDANRDLLFEENKIQKGSAFGINIHKAGANSTYVENWSEGCQVFKKSADFEEFMKIVRLARAVWGNSFTYTLIESSDIK
jgi:hypothetical protein